MGQRVFTQPMVLEAALTAPVTGQLILSWLYAHEQVVVFNSSWELRENFLADIYEIRGMLDAWRWHQSELYYESELYAELTRGFVYDRYGNIIDF